MSRPNATFARPNTKPTIIPSAARDLLCTIPRATRSAIAFRTPRPLRLQVEQPKQTLAKTQAP